jgi:cell division protein FtsI/penicillin-binding protein 2
MDVQLTIDAEIQRIAMTALDEATHTYNTGGGRVVVFDPHLGEVLAMGDVLRARAGVEFFTDDPLREADPAMGRLRCITDPYEPGSTFKAFVWARATEAGKVRIDEVFNTHNGVFRAPNKRVIHDAYAYDKLAWDMVLVKSSNIGMVQVIERMSDRELQAVVSDFGFGMPTGCGLPGETGGMVTSPGKWTHYTQQSVAMGHEIAVSPLQIVRAFSAFCRDGSLPGVRLVKGDDQIVPEARGRLQAQIEQRPIDVATAQLTRRVMRKLMLEGSGRRAEEGAMYRMFGKCLRFILSSSCARIAAASAPTR